MEPRSLSWLTSSFVMPSANKSRKGKKTVELLASMHDGQPANSILRTGWNIPDESMENPFLVRRVGWHSNGSYLTSVRDIWVALPIGESIGLHERFLDWFMPEGRVSLRQGETV